MEPRRTFPKDYTPGSWAVRKEFLRTDAPFPDPPFKEAESAGDAVDRAVRALGLPAPDPAALRLEREWRSIVGDDYALHATPGPLERGVLTLFVHGGSARYATIRRSAERDLLPRLNAALRPPPAPPLVRSIRVLRAT